MKFYFVFKSQNKKYSILYFTPYIKISGAFTPSSHTVKQVMF